MATSREKLAAWNLLTGLFFATAFILMWVGSMRCNFAKFVSTGGASPPIVREFGIWYYENFSYVASTDGSYIVKHCQSYPDDSGFTDSSWKAARAFSALTFITACIILLYKLFQACSSKKHSADPYNRDGYGGLAPLFLATALFQGLTLLFLNSAACKSNDLVGMGNDIPFEDKCAISQGAKLTISATVFWFAAAATSVMEGKAHAEVVQNRQEARDARLAEPLVP